MSVRRRKYTSSTHTGGWVGLIVKEQAQGTVDIATAVTAAPLGVVVDEEDDYVTVAIAGDHAHVLLSEDFEYSDGYLFTTGTSANVGKAAVVGASSQSTITTGTDLWAVGSLIVPGVGKADAGSLCECFINPVRLIAKAS